MKRAIYLDERERGLARRIIACFKDKLADALVSKGSVESVAVAWTWLEASKLLEKFEEPSQSETVTRQGADHAD